jgi:peptide/nickel transport system permease protein
MAGAQDHFGQASLIAGRVFRNRGALAGAVVLGVFLGSILLASELTSVDPTAIDLRHYLNAPSFAHLLGRDQFGRDVYSRVLNGGGLTLGASVIAVAMAATVGVSLGLFAGYSKGWAGALLMRVVDIGLAFPGIMVALFVVAVLGPGMVTVLVAVGVSLIPAYVRLVRGAVLTVIGNEYIETAHTMGVRPVAIIFRHVLPNIAAPVIVWTTSALGWGIIIASSMSFLGLGVSPPEPEWGADLRSSMSYLQQAPWLAAPGVCTLLAIVAFNLLGDGLRDAFDYTQVD